MRRYVAIKDMACKKQTSLSLTQRLTYELGLCTSPSRAWQSTSENSWS